MIAPCAAYDDENTGTLDSRLGTVVRCAHARRLQREPAIDTIRAHAPRAAERANDVAVVTDDRHGGIRNDTCHALSSRGAIRGSTRDSRARR